MLPLLALAACQTTTPTIGTGREVCLIWSGVTYSAKGDTARTVEEIRALNAKRDAYCGAKP
jgi:hypothetical protein